MRIWVAIAAALLIAGCDKKPKMMKIETPEDTKKELKSDPNGKYLCFCKFRTNEKTCPKCGTVLKAEEEPKKAAAAHAKTGAEVGKSATKPVYACPKCTFTEPKEGTTCIKHVDTKLQAQWFVCAGCSTKETVAGKCSKCKGDLTRTLE